VRKEVLYSYLSTKNIMYKDCLIFSFNKLGWSNIENVYALKGFWGIKDLEGQIRFIRPYLNVNIEYDESKKEYLTKWIDVLVYAHDKYIKYGNGVLLVWFEDDGDFGHAMPVINGEVIMGKQYIGENIAIQNAKVFITNYIYKI
jgi:hypothetical protein